MKESWTKSNAFDYLMRLFGEGLGMETTILEDGTIKAFVTNRSQNKRMTFFAKDMNDARKKAEEWQVGQILLNCEDFEEVVMYLANRKMLKSEIRA